MTSVTLRTSLYVGVTSLGAILLVFMTACGSIMLTLFLQGVLAAIIRVIATIGEIVIATIAAITSGFTISLTVVLAAVVSAVTFPPTHIEARLIISVTVATTSISVSALALFLMTSFQLDVELAVAVVTSGAVSVAFAAAWAVGIMSLVERETHHVGLKMTSLLQAVRQNQFRILRLLVKLPFGSKQDEINIALLYAVKANYVDCVRVLLSAGGNPNFVDPYDNTPLICACQSGSEAVVGLLLENGAVVDLCNNNRETALHHCAKWGFVECMKLLLSDGADPNVQDRLMRSPLMLAVRHAQEATTIIPILIEAGSDVNVVCDDHRTVLHHAAIRGIKINALLVPDVKLEEQDVDGNTPLHLAAREGHNDVISALLDAGGRVQPTNYNNEAPIHLAAAKEHLISMEILLQRGADPLHCDNTGYLPICHAVKSNQTTAILFLLQNNLFPGALSIPTYRTPPVTTGGHQTANCDSSVSIPSGSTVLSLGQSMSTSSAEFRYLARDNSHIVSPVRVALERRHYRVARMLVLGGCDVSPLGERELLDERRIWRDDDQMLQFYWLKASIQQPWPLLELCRIAIRHQLPQPVVDVPRLPVPTQLKQFLLLADLEDML